MSKVYIISVTDDKSVILELPSTKEAKIAYKYIRSKTPEASIGVYGARDLQTFRRTQRTIGSATVTRSVETFVKALNLKEKYIRREPKTTS
ncbi:hypothetical protein [Anoxybacillus flavithermus]|uniref:hypothetical protein n=1 Tax=Anoxybacillus flavithermus TaxID=33934 RepID=UPI000551CE47|nr:hypothetical protein [Anoxybacillus flavithermus]